MAAKDDDIEARIAELKQRLQEKAVVRWCPGNQKPCPIRSAKRSGAVSWPPTGHRRRARSRVFFFSTAGCFTACPQA